MKKWQKFLIEIILSILIVLPYEIIRYLFDNDILNYNYFLLVTFMSMSIGGFSCWIESKYKIFGKNKDKKKK